MKEKCLFLCWINRE